MKIELIFAWYDLWIGAFWDQKKKWLYVFPIPMCGIIIKMPTRRYYMYSERIKNIVGSGGDKKEVVDEGYKAIMYWAKNMSTERLFRTKDKMIESYEKEVNG